MHARRERLRAGTELTCTGVLQVVPPSIERDSAMPSRAPLKIARLARSRTGAVGCNRDLSQAGAVANRVPVSGSRAPIASRSAIRIGALQLPPLSFDRKILSVEMTCPPAPSSSCVNRLTSVPFGNTTITLPIVWLCGPGSKIERAASQVLPPSVVRAKNVGPPPLAASRSHTA